MATTKAGVEQARQTMMNRYGSKEAYLEHMRKIASKAGKKTGRKGFAVLKDLPLTDPNHPRNLGAKGGSTPKTKRK